MMIEILKTIDDVIPFLDRIRTVADNNRHSLGFLPASAYEQSALQGRLWVATRNHKEYLGHLLFGGAYPDIRVVQLCIDKQHRQGGIGSRIISELVSFGEEQQYLAITARVAADLPANRFWEKNDFCVVKVSPGGRAKGRTINTRVRALDAPRLFDLPVAGLLAHIGQIAYDATPTLRMPSFSLDLNVIIDLVQRRKAADAVGSLVRAALNHFVKIVVTGEAGRELERTHTAGAERDPILEFVRQLPTLPAVSEGELSSLRDGLRAIIFPHRSSERRGAQQDESDLVHLATCIHHGITGFVTSERALLRGALAVKEMFGLEIVSPYVFVEPSFCKQPSPLYLVGHKQQQEEVSFVSFEESQRRLVDDFLCGLHISPDDTRATLSPGASGDVRRRLCAFIGSEIAGIASWDEPSSFRRNIEFFLYVDETKGQVERIIEHFVGMALAVRPGIRVFGVKLQHGPGQSITRSMAVSRGFRSQAPASSSPYHELFKVVVSGVVTPNSWSNVRDGINELVGVALPVAMPDFVDVEKDGITLRQDRKGVKVVLSCFEIETLFSPGLILFPGRSGLIIPVREEYAERLFGGVRKQASFLPVQEALLRLEKAYFRAPAQVSLVRKGMPIVFYVSGAKAGVAIGHARVTATNVASVQDATIRYERQGVLPAEELAKRADRKGNVHVIAFDNFCRFGEDKSYKSLKEMGCVGPLNLQTIQCLGAGVLRALIEEDVYG